MVPTQKLLRGQMTTAEIFKEKSLPFAKGPSTHGEESVNELSTNTQWILDEEFFFTGEEFSTLLLINFNLFLRKQVHNLKKWQKKRVSQKKN